MPFIAQITQFINEALKAGSLKKSKLQPAKFYGLTTQVARSTKGSKNLSTVEILPAIITAGGKGFPMAPDGKTAIQIYHKLLSKTYTYEKKSYGEGYTIRALCDMNMVVFTNSKMTGRTKENLEPLFLFGMPQRISQALISDLQIINCLIVPVSSNMDHTSVFRQEYPQSDYFLNEQMSMFSIRYRIEMSLSQRCAEQCLCQDGTVGSGGGNEDTLRPILTEYGTNILTEGGSILVME